MVQVTKNIANFLFGGSFFVHLLLTAVMAWLAIDLSLPGDTFGTSTTYAAFYHTPPYTKDGWSTLFGCVALFGLAGILADRIPRAASWRKWIKLASVAGLGLGHFTFARLVWESAPLATATGTYGLIAVAAIWLIFKIGREES